MKNKIFAYAITTTTQNSQLSEMIDIKMTIYLVLLFVLMTPGVLFSFPAGAKKMTVAVVHGLIFALVYHFTHKQVWSMTH